MVYKAGGFAESISGNVSNDLDYKTRINSKLDSSLKKREQDLAKKKAEAEIAEKQYNDLLAKQEAKKPKFGDFGFSPITEDMGVLEKTTKTFSNIMNAPIRAVAKVVTAPIKYVASEEAKTDWKKTKDWFKRSTQGEQGSIESSFQLLGDVVLGVASNVIGEAVTGFAGEVVKPITESSSPELKTKIKSSAINILTKLAQTKPGSALLNKVVEVQGDIAFLEKEDPGYMANWRGLFNILEVALDFAGGSLGKEAIEEGTEAFSKKVAPKILDFSTDALEKAGTLIKKTPLNKVVKESGEELLTNKKVISKVEMPKILEYIDPKLTNKQAIEKLTKSSSKKGYDPGAFFSKVSLTPDERQLAKAQLTKEIGFEYKNPVKDIIKINDYISEISENVIKPTLKANANPINKKSLRLSLTPKQGITNIKGTQYEKIVTNILDTTVENAMKLKTTDKLWDAKKEFIETIKMDLGDVFGNNPKKLNRIMREINNNYTDYIAKQIPDGDVIFKQNMKKFNLGFELAEEMATKYKKMIGTSGFSRSADILKDVPVVGRMLNKTVVGGVDAVASKLPGKALKYGGTAAGGAAAVKILSD